LLRQVSAIQSISREGRRTAEGLGIENLDEHSAPQPVGLLERPKPGSAWVSASTVNARP
jgi:hypothetical protein